ncbi:MAG: ABC transporter ATP-binding protein [Tepidisphaeraceae bacterium]|jgi:lipopolysaccharide transport system ATP-binding protein
MSEIAIKIEGLGKRYRIGQRKKYKTFRESIVSAATSPFRRLTGNPGENGEASFWALREVGFEVRQGDVVGIIGRNGAGKSTLLKILSRITEPTEGRVEISGRVGSLLEVGTGFHPELTGRENIYLNGAILGMKKTEIDRKFDEIVAFAETEKFLDTPAKHYSSGMYTRLAFAVAAHLEPEILVVDEVLAVGDVQFQQKCLGKMNEVAKEGRTVLFVSHNMGAVVSLCTRGILMQSGRLIADGPTDEVLSQYLSHVYDEVTEIVDDTPPSEGQRLKIRRVRVVDSAGRATQESNLTAELWVEVNFDVQRSGAGYTLALRLFESQHGCVFTTSSFDYDPESRLRQTWEPGRYTARFRLPTEMLRGGEYWLTIAAAIPMVETLHNVERELHFRLLDTTSPVIKSSESRWGAVLPILDWNTTKVSEL